MAIIDSQVHAYAANTPKRPWHSVPNWPDHVTGDEMAAAMDKVGVDGARSEEHTSELQSLS
jgi:L-fuconolactonase